MKNFVFGNDQNSLDLLHQLCNEEKYRRSKSTTTTKMNIKESIDLMYKLVQKHLKQIRKLGEKIDYECDLYEQKHLKNSSPSSSSLLNESIHLYNNNNNIIIDNDDDMNNDDKHLNFYLNQKCQLIQNEKFGRHFITKDQILKGEIIIEERPIIITFYEEHRQNYCHYCYHHFSNNKKRISCKNCDEIYYCSNECRQICWQQYHRFECGLYGLIAGPSDLFSFGNVFRYYSIFGHKLIDKCTQQQQQSDDDCNVHDNYIHNKRFQLPRHKWSYDERFQLCQLISKLVDHRYERKILREVHTTLMSWILIHLFVRRKILDKNILDDCFEFSRRAEYIARDFSRMQTNSFCWSDGPIDLDETSTLAIQHPQQLVLSNMIANCIECISSFFNHSCKPNLYWQFNSNGIIICATRSIKQGEQLTISYGTDFNRQTFDQRQISLQYNYCFYCQCIICNNDCSIMKNVIKCLNDKCSGPLVLNKHNACISCGKFPFDLRNAYRLMNKMKRIKSEFGYLFDSINGHEQYRIYRILYFFRYRSKFQLYWKSNSDKQRKKRIEYMEKLYEKYRQISYYGSYRLLYLSIIMLAIYERFEMPYKAFELIDTIDMNLMNIFPGSISNENIDFIIQLLEFLGEITERLSKKIYSNDYHLFQQSQQNINHNDEILIRSKFSCLFERVNQLLLAFFDEDLKENGWLFPRTFKQLHDKPDNDEDNDESVQLRTPDQENYYINLYRKCQQRKIPVS
ncbi:hypothetical protein DERP_007189 [Dermatophagoides pteronyssinus]|uniref:SET and MYND domain-containing protein 4-like n=1 Tax=Dermatophagoides pteronyssinus TaxID=6956 RepID=A0ABQ8JUF3_DERPT|nr:hypothetical protein DERP_007189 [Dermatophagoides pteronyssinus]